MEGWTEVLSIIGTLVLMAAVFAAAYFVSKYVGKHYKPSFGLSKNISVIDSAVVGKDRSLLLVKVGEKALLIGSTPNEFTLLSELEAGQFEAASETEQAPQKDFITTFRSVVKSKLKRTDDGEEN
ncbi:MAG: flagellar biosynthetic protein FliO [Oscillospiraceae bacterium]|nr:flagellar biosynthetic protein FliO [Oscillospiraceae bacterium]